MTDPEDVRELLDDRPDLESSLEAVLEPEEPWQFEDVDVDSGSFGELVSRGYVENTGDGYRVPGAEAVSAVLGGEESPGKSSRDISASLPDTVLPRVGRLEVAALVLSLLFVAVLRLVSFGSVYRGDTIVLLGNDPYYYRYWVEQVITSPEITLSTLPNAVKLGEPLFVATLAWVSRLLGGSRETVGTVLAWYPVVSAVLTAGLVYSMSKIIWEDRRIALASVVLLALTPVHAFRTSLGFADHHAFDYVWLVLIPAAVTIVIDEFHSRKAPRPLRVVVAIACIGVGVAGQTLAWEAGPLMLVALAGFLVVGPLVAARTGTDPARIGVPILVGVGLGAAVTWQAHTMFGWHTTLVAVAPLLLFFGGVAAVGSTVICHRFRLSLRVVPIVLSLGVVGVLLSVPNRYPETWTRVVTNVDQRLFRTEAIAETGGLFGQSFGWILLFGFVFLLAVPYIALGVRRSVDHLEWVLPSVYGLYFTFLAIVQIRFAGQMAPFVAMFAGIGFLHLTEWVSITDRPPMPFSEKSETDLSLSIPDRATLQSFVVVLLLVGSLSAVQIPVKTSQLTHSDGQYDAATWMEDHSQTRDLTYPENYVFSQWGDNRFYNYVVNGQSQSYRFAKALFQDFFTANDSERWYTRLRGEVGYIVLSPAADGPDTGLAPKLYDVDENQTRQSPGFGRYRMVYASGVDGYKVFTLVPGATINGTTTDGGDVTVSTTVDVGSYSFRFERVATAGPDGRFSVTVPYSGEYRVGNRTVSVTEGMIDNGTTVLVGEAR